MKRDGLSIAGLCISIVLVIIFILILGHTFPLYAAGSPTEVTEPSLLYEKVSFALWNLRASDMIILGLVLFFSAVSCIAMFRREME